ncbi:hypothetical protein [Mucilaginibacter sp.]|uniref:hypothetical protein n=1 Tax=Mucilaginibacter sp. TaxID=1882438 RepID=UPI0025DB7787|nr:hypothetical protein [Mucilaginibacter sp.]
MNKLKKYTIALLLILSTSCGTSGHIQFYDFTVPESEVKKELISIINLNDKYKAPLHWNNYELGETKDDIFIYFDSNPKELYVVGFREYKELSDKNESILALIGLFDGKLWHFARDLNRDEENRAKGRLEKEILSKMKLSYKKE